MKNRLLLTRVNRIVLNRKNVKIAGTNVSGTAEKQLILPERIEPEATKTNKNYETNRDWKIKTIRLLAAK